MLVKYSRIRDVLILILYKFSFDLVYLKNVSPAYAYSGFTFNFIILKYLLLTLFFFLFIKPTIYLYNSSKASSKAILLFTFLYFIPGLTYISFVKIKIYYIIFYFLYWIFMLIWNNLDINIRIPKLKKSNALFLLYALVLFTIIFVLYLSGKFTNFRFHFDIFNVYGIRAEERGLNMPLLFRYLLTITSSIIPILIIYFLVEKKKIYVVILVILQLLLFGIGGHKYYLFSLLISLLIYFFYSKRKFYLISLGFLAINVIAFIEGCFRGGKSVMVSFIHHRLLLLPNQISYFIYDFMQSNELLYLRTSILRFFGFNPPYMKSLDYLIGEKYYGDSFIRANNGVCGDAYSQFGFISLFFYTFLILIAFNILDSVSRGLNNKIVFFVVFLFTIIFINGSFFTVLLTNGFIVACIILYILSSFKGDAKSL